MPKDSDPAQSDCVTIENGSRKLQLAFKKCSNRYIFRSLEVATTTRMYDYDTASEDGVFQDKIEKENAYASM